MKIHAPVVLAVLLGCVPAEGPTMRPGEDCLRCHGGSPGGDQGLEVKRAIRWTLAGTVYALSTADPSAGVEGAQVQVTDATGFVLHLDTNQAGNFYTAETLTFPLRACALRHGQLNCMDGPVEHGACNFCHAPNSGALGDPGRIAAP
jgi:hypothetical protein